MDDYLWTSKVNSTFCPSRIGKSTMFNQGKTGVHSPVSHS